MTIKTRVHTENVTPQKARLWLSENYARQRRIRKFLVGHYADEMRKGRWHPTNPIAFAYLNGNKYLINGQHTLAAVVESGVTILLNPIHYHEVSNEDEIDSLYAHYDIGLGRGYADSLEAYSIVDRAGIPKTAIEKMSSAIVYTANGFSRHRKKRVANEDLIEVVLNRVDDYKALDDAISPCDTLIRNRIMMQPVLSVAMVTMEYQLEKALEFWSQVAQLDGLSRSDARMALHKALITMPRVGSNAPEGFQSEHFTAVSAHAWNKWYSGVDLTYVRPTYIRRLAAGKEPIVIDGTPYDGVNNPT